MCIGTRALWSCILPLTLLALAYNTNDAFCFRACRCITHLSKAALSTVSVRFPTSIEMEVAVQKDARAQDKEL